MQFFGNEKIKQDSVVIKHWSDVKYDFHPLYRFMRHLFRKFLTSSILNADLRVLQMAHVFVTIQELY